jgi:hypothetical protein
MAASGLWEAPGSGPLRPELFHWGCKHP